MVVCKMIIDSHSRFMISLILGSWRGFQYQALFPSGWSCYFKLSYLYAIQDLIKHFVQSTCLSFLIPIFENIHFILAKMPMPS